MCHFSIIIEPSVVSYPKILEKNSDIKRVFLSFFKILQKSFKSLMGKIHAIRIFFLR